MASSTPIRRACGRPSSSRVLNVPLDRGYVAQTPGYGDRRLRFLALTEAGGASKQCLLDMRRERLTHARQEVGRQAVAGFHAVMRALMDADTRAYLDRTGAAGDA